jgi:hypothetical protein
MSNVFTKSATVRWLLCPVVYAAAVPPVFALVGAAVVALERSIGLHTWQRVGDIDGAAALAISDTLIFVPVTLMLTRFEALRRPAALDHFRHSYLLYLLAIISGAWLVTHYENLNGALQYAYAVGFFATTTFAIAVNAATLRLLGSGKETAA